jgi:hypothetical protein
MHDHAHLLVGGGRDDADLKRFVKNPVRAGLVSSPLDYPFWGSLVYSREELLAYISWAA